MSKDLEKRIEQLEGSLKLMKKANQIAREQYINRVVNTKISYAATLVAVAFFIQFFGTYLLGKSPFSGEGSTFLYLMAMLYFFGFCLHMAMIYRQRLKIKAEWNDTRAKIEAAVGKHDTDSEEQS